MLRGFRYRFYPTPEQEALLRRTLGCCRLVYNKALHARSEAWTSGKKPISYVKQSAALTAWKKTDELAFLNEVSSVPLQQSLRHLQTAYTNFFAKRAKYPGFKNRRRGGSAEFTRSAFRIVDGEVQLAKMGAPLSIRWSRPLPTGAEPSSVTVSLDAAGRWHVSILCDDPSIKPLKTCSACGFVRERLDLSTRRWRCEGCDAEHDRDHNAAKNVLAAGLAVSACGPGVSHRILRNAVQSGLKQESSAVKPGIAVRWDG